MQGLTPISFSLFRSLLLGVACSHCAFAHQFIPIAGPESGTIASEANAVDAFGKTVVGRFDVNGVSTGFVWTLADGLQPVDGARQFWGISGDGRLAVGESPNPTTGLNEPIRWTSSAGLHFLGGPDGATLNDHTRATAASFDGSIVVGTTDYHTTKAFSWTESNGFELLNPIDPFNPIVDVDFATDISADGKVVVGTLLPWLGQHIAFRWTAETGMTLLGTLPNGFDESNANAVSADGSVVVGYSALDSFCWTEATGMVELTPLAVPGAYNIYPAYDFPNATTQSGEAIVGTGNGTVAYVWTEARGMESLQLVLENRFNMADELAGWKLEEATDISPDGRAIVGKGYNPDGNLQGWLVRLDRPIFVPEPSALALVLFAACPVLISAAARRHGR